MQHELEFAFRESLEMIQIPVISFDTLELREKLDAQSYLQRQILEQEITHLVLLGDSMLDDEKFISRQKLHALRADFGLIVIPVFMDCLLSTNGIHMLEFWHDLSDISIIFHPQLIPYFEDRGKRYCAWPSLPYPEIWFDSFLTATKEESLCVPGSSHRYRREWANYAERHKVPISVEINDRTNNTSNTFTLEEYFKELGKSRLVFTNGYRNRKESQVVAKVTEIMLVNSLLLYQSGSLIDFFFEPYKHYIPIHDFPDLVDKSRFLLSNPTVSEQVIRQGRNHVIQNYSTSIFWEKVFSQ